MSDPKELKKNTSPEYVGHPKGLDQIPLQNMCLRSGPRFQHHAIAECLEDLPEQKKSFQHGQIFKNLVKQDMTRWNVDDDLALCVVLLLVDQQKNAMVLVPLVKT